VRTQGAKGNLPYLLQASGNSEKEANDMSLVTGTARTGEAEAVGEAPLLDGRPVIIGVAAICTFYVCVRIYEQIFGWYAGLDSFAPEFTTY
jgi:methane/ammonia monooxygenase subunit C